MLFFVIVIIIIALIAICYNWYDEGGCHLFFLGLIVLCVLAWFGVTKINDAVSGEIVHKSEIIPISAFVDNRETNGMFNNSIFIGSGYVDEELYYYYIENTEIGKRVRKVSTKNENVYIKEIDGKPILKREYDIREGCSIWSYNAIFNAPTNEIYIFEVPNDTVTTEFNIDLK
jgi:hypothetical protein